MHKVYGYMVCMKPDSICVTIRCFHIPNTEKCSTVYQIFVTLTVLYIHKAEKLQIFHSGVDLPL